MLSLTQQERLVLCVFVLTVTFGSLLQYVFKKYPEVQAMIAFLDHNHFVKKVNINTADLDGLLGIPYIGPVRARRILEYRKQKKRFIKKEELLNIRGIGRATYKKMESYIKVKD